jgi:cytochrome c oxidase cbb3-type subunit I/II
LHRVGKKYPNKWHYDHLLDPTLTSPWSIMPPYPWLINQKIDTASTAAKITAMRKLGVPYPKEYENYANKDLLQQAKSIVDDLKQSEVDVLNDREIIAIIAYLQRLGTDIKVTEK